MTEAAPPRRRLAAVLFADIVEFSSLASSDEDQALALGDLFRTVFREQVAERRGRVVKFLGDGGMATFDSAEAAAATARELVREFGLAAESAEMPSTLRVGIHVGDVMEGPDGDVHGDGVNTAARLERAAEGGEILVSEAVWRQLRQRRGFSFRYLGERELKGMAAPERTYALLPAGGAAPAGAAAPRSAGRIGRATAFRGRLPRWTRAVRHKWIVAGIAALAVVVAYSYLSGPPPGAGVIGGSSRLARLTITLPEGQLLALSHARAHPLGISRDGRRIVYGALSGASTRLFLRPIDGFDALPLSGTEGARQPFFSPDGEWVAFFAEGSLQKVPVAGGAPISIAAVPGIPYGADWGPDDTILFAMIGGGLLRVPAGGGEPAEVSISRTIGEAQADGGGEPLTDEFVSLGILRWPAFLPDGEHAVVTTDAGVHVLDLETGTLRFLFPGSQARYLPTGHLLYNAGGERVRAVPFDLERLEVTGPARPAIDNVFRGPGGGAANFVVSETGTLVYIAGGFERALFRVDRNGRETPIDVEPRGYRFPDVSPDGRYLAVTVDPRPSDVWVIDLERESATRLTTEGHNLGAVWSPDGSRLAFTHEGDPHVVGWPDVGKPLRVVERPGGQFGLSWGHDGRILAQETRAATGVDLIALDLDDGEVEEFLVTPADEHGPRVSPDGRWVAFESDVSGADEIYVVPYSGSSTPRLVSVGGGVGALWSTDGTELFYRRGNTVMAVDVNSASGFRAGPPHELFPASSYDFTQGGNWSVGPDGRFVMVKADPTTSRQLRVVLDWFDELGRR